MVTATPDNASKSGSISVRPYFDPSVSNLGLEKYGQSLFDGVFHEEQLALIERNGIKRYITGLNEFAPEIKDIKDPSERDAKIKSIRETVAQLEKELAANLIDPEDPDFWNKVIVLKPNNDEFWGKISLRCSNQSLFLDPAKDPYDLIKLYAIEAGGFPMVARSFEDARKRAVPPKFYLDKLVETVSTRTEVTKMRNKALGELTQLFNKHQNKLFFVAKIIDINSTQYKKSTPVDIIYENMDAYINGLTVDSNKKRTAENFINIANLDMETLKLRAIVKDANSFRYIYPRPDGFIYHIDSATMMGRNPSECVEFLKNPLNEQILADIQKRVEYHWNK